MSLSAFVACTLYFCFKLYDVNSVVNITPSMTGSGFCEKNYRLPVMSEVVAIYDLGGYIPYNKSYTFLVRDIQSKLSIMYLHTGNDTAGPSFHVLTKQHMKEFVTHKICVLSRKEHAPHHAIFTVVAMIAMAVFGAIIVVYLLVLFCCLCRRMSACNNE